MNYSLPDQIIFMVLSLIDWVADNISPWVLVAFIIVLGLVILFLIATMIQTGVGYLFEIRDAF